MLKQWSNYSEFFRALDDVAEYVVLRSFENLTEPGREERDIDILCRDTSTLAKAVGAVRFRAHKDSTDYRVHIGSFEQKLDVYEPTSGYYCREWCDDILSKRRRYDGLTYAPDSQNYFFSLLYQARLLHRTFPDKHIETLKRLALEIGVKYEGGDAAHDMTLLNEFLKSRGYEFTLPRNWEVRPNWELVATIDGSMRPSIPWMRILRAFRRLAAKW